MMNSKEEKWEILNEYPNYMISTFGRIKNIKTQEETIKYRDDFFKENEEYAIK